MQKKIFPAIFLLVFLAGPAVSGWSQNFCVECHQKLEPSFYRAHDYDEWAKSIHAKKGVTCEKCHGGNPQAKEASKAHTQFVKSNNPKNPLYFSNVPETCGQCHAVEFDAFKESYHYKELKRSGRGPNCLTCHGSMATWVLRPEQLDNTCSLCHRKRSSASQALVALNLTKNVLKKWESLAGVDQNKVLAEQKMAFKQAHQKWHSLDMQEVLKQTKEILLIAEREMQSLRLKKGVR